MYQLTRLEYIEKDYEFSGRSETILIELYIDYITNKIYWLDHAYIKEYDESIYGKNPNSKGTLIIKSAYRRTDYLTEDDIILKICILYNSRDNVIIKNFM